MTQALVTLAVLAAIAVGAAALMGWGFYMALTRLLTANTEWAERFMAFVEPRTNASVLRNFAEAKSLTGHAPSPDVVTDEVDLTHHPGVRVGPNGDLIQATPLDPDNIM